MISFAVTQALISFAVTAKLICACVFAYADCWFSHAAAHIYEGNISSSFLVWILRMIPVHECYPRFQKHQRHEESERMSYVVSTQQAHDVRMTSDRRQCDVMTSHRR